MTDMEQKEIFGKNLSRLVELSGHTRKEVAEILGFNYKTFNGWCNGISIPGTGKIQAIADFFHVGKSRLLDPWKSDSQDIGGSINEEYFDEETAEIARHIQKNSILRGIFDTAKDIGPDELKALQVMAEALLRKERHED